MNLPEEEFTGSQVDFFDKATGKPVETVFEPGKAIIHSGTEPRVTHSIISGQRSNLVVWLYGDRMQVPIGGAGSYGNTANNKSSIVETANVTARERWTAPETPKDTFAPF